MLTQGLGHPVYAKVTVWTFGTGTPFYVADPASLLHLLPQFIEGQKFLHSNKWSPPV
jgi:hypothetical protein